MLKAIQDRALHAYQIVILPIWLWIFLFGLGVILGVYREVISIAVAPDKRGPYDIWNLLPHLQAQWWVAIISCVVIAIIFEASFRYQRKSQKMGSIRLTKQTA
jgi:H+/Cl- antiporter ClcA